MNNMFNRSKTTIGYAKVQTFANKFNNSKFCLTFVVK